MEKSQLRVFANANGLSISEARKRLLVNTQAIGRIDDAQRDTSFCIEDFMERCLPETHADGEHHLETVMSCSVSQLPNHVFDFASWMTGKNIVLLPYSDYGYPMGICHANGYYHAQKYGGKQVFGWLIWQHGNTFEAEFHSVWETPQGQLKDISPRYYGEKVVLFVPDPKRKYDMQNNRSWMNLIWDKDKRYAFPDSMRHGSNEHYFYPQSNKAWDIAREAVFGVRE